MSQFKSANIIVVLGRPGAGKTTIAQAVSKKFGYQHISAGDVARLLALSDMEVADALAKGQLAPRDKMNDAMYTVLKKHNEMGGTIVLDGYPRYFAQLADLLHAQRTEPLFIILSCSAPTASNRLRSRKRNDDTIEQIKTRFDTFDAESVPVISWALHRHAHLSKVIDAEGSESRVVGDVISYLQYTF